ncbi:MAG: helix-turn-helix domain-containing protein [Burkholderiaceae bacterium]
MGRKSKLTEAQWFEVERRLVEGVNRTALAREYGISEAAIRQRKTSDVEKIKSVANQLVATTLALRELPITSQTSAQNFAARMLALQDNVVGAAAMGAANAHRLHGIANGIVQRVDDSDPLASMESMKAVALLTKMGNDAAHIALNLLAANKGAPLESPELPSSLPENVLDAAAVYARVMGA